MALKTGFFSLALCALLLGTTAQAAGIQGEHDASSVVAQDFRGGSGPAWGTPSNTYDSRRTPPPPPARQNGRYELRQVQKWVAGHYAQVWVGQDCSDQSRRYIRKCEPGHYEQRWVPGHYEQAEEWVWVPGVRRGGYRRA
jgi:hypothetical protein